MNIELFAKQMKQEVEKMTSQEVWIGKIAKPNNGSYYAISLVSSNGQQARPLVRLEPLYDEFLFHGDRQSIAARIIDLLQAAQLEESVRLDSLSDPNYVRQNVFFTLVNYKNNQEFLRTTPHTRYLDLAKIYYVYCNEEGLGEGRAVIDNDYLNTLQISVDELNELAELNTPRLFPACIISINTNVHEQLDLKQEPSWEQGAFPEANILQEAVLTNTKSYYGSSAICYKNSLKNIAAKMGTDFLVLPFSIHRVICQPLEERDDIPRFKQVQHFMAEDAEQPSDVLSDNTYLYTRATGELTIV